MPIEFRGVGELRMDEMQGMNRMKMVVITMISSHIWCRVLPSLVFCGSGHPFLPFLVEITVLGMCWEVFVSLVFVVGDCAPLLLSNRPVVASDYL